ncbi:MAG: hypothetical protein Q9221_006732 [Calogaya cf. arnoldii]
MTQAIQPLKAKTLRTFPQPMTGREDLLNLDGDSWKRWRRIFNPGFSATHVSSLIPGIVEEAEVFKNALMEHATKGGLFYLESLTLDLTIDIIGRVVMDLRFNSQTEHNAFTAALRMDLDRLPYQSLGVFQRPTPLRSKEQYLATRSVIDLALEAYLEEHPSAKGKDADFKEFAVAQIKLLIFAGYDTISTGAVLAYHLLAKHPRVLAKRESQSNLAIITEKGQSLPTENCMVWGDHYGTHYNPRYWLRPSEFLPERFLVAEDDPLHPPKNGWRPFERGPRNCIGQELALTEIKVMLALTVRELNFEERYEEFDKMKGNPKVWNFNGERAYMMRRPGAFPADHYPCRASRFKGDGIQERNNVVTANNQS